MRDTGNKDGCGDGTCEPAPVEFLGNILGYAYERFDEDSPQAKKRGEELNNDFRTIQKEYRSYLHMNLPHHLKR